MINKDYVTDTLQKLVQINSVNPALEKGGGGEEEIGRFIYRELQNLGVEVELDEIEARRVQELVNLSYLARIFWTSSQVGRFHFGLRRSAAG